MTQESADRFCKGMHLLLSNSDFPITIYINSPGGEWDQALAIYDTIVDAETQVLCEVKGQCMSAAVPIAQACDVRLIHPNAVVMAHNGTWTMGTDSHSFEQWGKRAKLERRRMHKILASKSGKPETFWRRKLARGDLILDAVEAVGLGLFDGIITQEWEEK